MSLSVIKTRIANELIDRINNLRDQTLLDEQRNELTDQVLEGLEVREIEILEIDSKTSRRQSTLKAQPLRNQGVDLPSNVQTVEAIAVGLFVEFYCSQKEILPLLKDRYGYTDPIVGVEDSSEGDHYKIFYELGKFHLKPGNRLLEQKLTAEQEKLIESRKTDLLNDLQRLPALFGKHREDINENIRQLAKTKIDAAISRQKNANG